MKIIDGLICMSCIAGALGGYGVARPKRPAQPNMSKWQSHHQKRKMNWHTRALAKYWQSRNVRKKSNHPHLATVGVAA